MPPEDEIRPNSDFSALLRGFNDANVDYLLIGGRAYSFTISLDEAWPHRVEGRHGDEFMWVIGVEDLIANKRAAGRPSDLIDVQKLERRMRRAR